MRDPVADEVEEQSEWQRAKPRADERAAGSTGRNVKGDDQASSLASRRRPSRLAALAAKQAAASVIDSIVADVPLIARATRAHRLSLNRCPFRLVEAHEDRVAQNLPQGLGHRLPRANGKLDNRVQVRLFIRTNLNPGAHGVQPSGARPQASFPTTGPGKGV